MGDVINPYSIGYVFILTVFATGAGLYPAAALCAIGLIFMCAQMAYHMWSYYKCLYGEVRLIETITTWRRCLELGIPLSSEEAHMVFDGDKKVTVGRSKADARELTVVLTKTEPGGLHTRPKEIKIFACDQYADTRAARRDGYMSAIPFTSGKALNAWVAEDGVQVFEYDGTFAVCTPVKSTS